MQKYNEKKMNNLGENMSLRWPLGVRLEPDNPSKMRKNTQRREEMIVEKSFNRNKRRKEWEEEDNATLSLLALSLDQGVFPFQSQNFSVQSFLPASVFSSLLDEFNDHILWKRVEPETEVI